MFKDFKIFMKIPDNINIIIENNEVVINGILGKLNLLFDDSIIIKIKSDKLFLYNKDIIIKKYNIYSYLKTIYSLIKNMIIGVTEGFNKKLLLYGVGYKCELIECNILKLNVGFSHEIKYHIPYNIKIECINYSEININGIDKQLVGKVASDIRNFKKPEPYKGKGIRYLNEKIILKESNKKK